MGVVVVSSANIMQLLRAMKESKGQFNPDAYYPIKMLPRLNSSVRSYVKNNLEEGFGARLVYNRQGMPTIIGIGQSSKIEESNDARANSVYTRIAQESAQQNAINAITQMFDMQTQVEVSITDKAEFSKNVVAEYIGCDLATTDENQPTEASYEKFLNIKETSTFKTQLTGAKLVRNDSYYHTSLKRKIYYTAYEWSPSSELGIKNYQQAMQSDSAKKPGSVTQQASSAKPATGAQNQFGGYSSQSPTSLVPDF